MSSSGAEPPEKADGSHSDELSGLQSDVAEVPRVDGASAEGNGAGSEAEEQGEGEVSPEPPPEKLYVITNETNQKLEIESADKKLLVLAPFERRPGLGEEDVERFALRDWGDLVRVEDEAQSLPGLTWELTTTVLGLSVWGVVVWFFIGLGQHWPAWWAIGWAVLLFAVLIAVSVDVVRSRPAAALRFAVRSAGRVYRWTGRQLNLVTGLLIGLVLPTAAIFFSADILSLIDSLRANGIHEHHVLLTLIGRIMQITFIAIASLLPTLLFFLFDREHLATLRARFMRQIMRFDPTVATTNDVVAKYGAVIDEAYGRDVSGKILPGRRSPLLLATLVVTLGWTLTLLHGDLTLVGEKDATIINLFEPRKSAICFAFVGAYFYGVNAMLRGYIRRDLRPKTYSTLTVRVFIVVVLAWLLELRLDGVDLYVIAFLSGIVPETALVVIKEALKGPTFAKLPLFSEEPDPLTNLEGIDLYDRARMFDEGVTNIESLAHHDLVELMLQTRIPVPRLIDWVDQAVLYLHAGPQDKNGGSKLRRETLDKLRGYGIRTATDLDNAFAAARSSRELEAFVHVLDDDPKHRPARLQLIKDALDDDEWMLNLRAWRDQESLALKSRRLRVPRMVLTHPLPQAPRPA